MTTEPNPTDTPEPEAALTPAEPPVVTPPPVVVVPAERPWYGSSIVRIGLGVIAAALIFVGGFATGHWVFDRHDDDHRRPDFSARAQRFMQDLRQPQGNNSRNAPQMGQAPDLQQFLAFLAGLLGTGTGSGNLPGGNRAMPSAPSLPTAPSSDLAQMQRQIRDLQNQVRQLQDQLRTGSPPATPTAR